MDNEEFIYFCEHFDFTKYPESQLQFMKKQVVVMKQYITKCRNNGDGRTNNEILLQWISSKNSTEFRKNWVLEYCKGTKSEDKYFIPEKFYVNKR